VSGPARPPVAPLNRQGPVETILADDGTELLAAWRDQGSAATALLVRIDAARPTALLGVSQAMRFAQAILREANQIIEERVVSGTGSFH
jgi:hypothetical protein